MTTRDVVLVALFAALTATLGLFPPLTVPVIGVPVTAQSMGPMLAGAILGWRRAGLAMLLFAALVLAGLPLLAGGRGGLGILAGPTGGFFAGFPLAAAAVGALHQRYGRGRGVAASALFNVVGGIVVLYAVGVPWLAAVAHLPLLKAIGFVVVFLPGDILKAVLTALIADAARRAYPLAEPGA